MGSEDGFEYWRTYYLAQFRSAIENPPDGLETSEKDSCNAGHCVNQHGPPQFAFVKMPPSASEATWIWHGIGRPVRPLRTGLQRSDSDERHRDGHAASTGRWLAGARAASLY